MLYCLLGQDVGVLEENMPLGREPMIPACEWALALRRCGDVEMFEDRAVCEAVTMYSRIAMPLCLFVRCL